MPDVPSRAPAPLRWLGLFSVATSLSLWAMPGAEKHYKDSVFPLTKQETS